MGTADYLEIKHKPELTEKQLAKADAFIMKDSTTGEFINTFRYLDYHPEGRFQDDSIVVMDRGSGEVRGVMMAARGDNDSIISYPGTTFAGPVVDRTAKLETTEAVLDRMLGYYESKYSEVKIKKQPEYYAAQPFHLIDYILLRRGYDYGMSALANIICIDGIGTEEDTLALFHAKRRNQVRKVIREGIFALSRQEEIRETVWKNMNEIFGISMGQRQLIRLRRLEIYRDAARTRSKSFMRMRQTAHMEPLHCAFCLKRYFIHNIWMSITNMQDSTPICC